MREGVNEQRALFGAGCFWGVQYYFDQVPGVNETVVGYSGGYTVDPSYEEVCRGDSGHAEVVLLYFDTNVVDYQMLLRHFLRLHDPTQLNRQGPDVGSQYRSAVYYYDEEQKELAKSVLQKAQSSYDSPIVTQLAPAGDFYRAEQYHQSFTERTGRGMCHVDYQPIETSASD